MTKRNLFKMLPLGFLATILPVKAEEVIDLSQYEVVFFHKKDPKENVTWGYAAGIEEIQTDKVIVPGSILDYRISLWDGRREKLISHNQFKQLFNI